MSLIPIKLEKNPQKQYSHIYQLPKNHIHTTKHTHAPSSTLTPHKNNPQNPKLKKTWQTKQLAWLTSWKFSFRYKDLLCAQYPKYFQKSEVFPYRKENTKSIDLM